MNPDRWNTTGRLLVCVCLLALLLAACGGGSGESDDQTTGPPTTQATTTTPPTTATTTTTAAAPTTTDAGQADAALIALGEMVYFETAGDVGCDACHGQDALGDIGPNIVGKSAETIRVNIETNENMTFIILSDEEIEAVAAYLATLETPAP